MKNNKQKKITPKLVAGFNDYLPKDMIPRQRMFDTIRNVCELYGFVPLEGPCVEREEILTGGDPDFKKNIYSVLQFQDFKKIENAIDDGMVKDEKERIFGEGKALRFDLTIQFARLLAQYPELPRPLKRYQRGVVWRGEKPQEGRYREFTQFDVDIAGSTSMMADAEIIAIMSAVMKALGVENFVIKVNNRKVLNGLSECAGFNNEITPDVLRIIDKLDKIQWEGVQSGLKEIGLNENQVDVIKKFIEINGSNSEMLMKASELMKGAPTALVGISELQEISKNLEALGVNEALWKIDFSIARGLGYYTGPVFETEITGLPDDFPIKGSVFSGGRYDGLVEKFSNEFVPATGAAVGVDRLFAMLQKLGILSQEKTVAQAMVLNFDKTAEEYVQKITTELRSAGIKTELYLGQKKGLRDQLSFAVSSEVPFAIIAGETEMKKDIVLLKNLLTRTQEEVDKSEIVAKVRSVIS